MSRQSATWMRLAAVVAVAVASLPFFYALLQVSTTNRYAGHVVFVPIFAAILVWLERDRLRDLSGSQSTVGAVLAAAALVALGIGYEIANVPLQAIAFVGAIVSLAFWFYGIRGIREVGFALVFLLCIVPPPENAIAAVAPGIQRFVAVFCGVLLDVLRIPVEQEGVRLQLPGLTLEVLEGCAALRFLLIVFVFVSAFARIVLPTFRSQLLLIALSIPLAILTNAMRVATITAGAYLVGPHVATGPLHYYIGKGFWGLAFLCIIGFAVVIHSRTTSGVTVAGRIRAPA